MAAGSWLKEWGGESIHAHRDLPSGAWIFIAVHSSRLGPATGGTRMRPYPDPEAALADALRLAEAMTYKYAVADFPRGGGKAVIDLPAGFDPNERSGLLGRYGSLLARLGGLFATGPDVGTTPADMDRIAETGSPYVFCRTPERGGAGGSGPATALGVFAALQATARHLFGDESLAGRRILVQGAGSVGGPLIERLIASGARVSFSDIDPAASVRFRSRDGVEAVDPESVFDVACDLFAPCSGGGVLNARTIPRLSCRAVVGAANNQLGEPGDAEALAARGILYAPDFVVNAGGALAITGMEAMGWSPERAEREVLKIGATLQGVFDLAEKEKITPAAAARRLAEARLARAGGIGGER